MLLPEVKEHLMKATNAMREEALSAGLGPVQIVNDFISMLEPVASRSYPWAKKQIRKHVRNIEENRKEAEQAVAAALGLM